MFLSSSFSLPPSLSESKYIKSLKRKKKKTWKRLPHHPQPQSRPGFQTQQPWCMAAVPSLIGTSDWFHGRSFCTDQEGGGDRRRSSLGIRGKLPCWPSAHLLLCILVPNRPLVLVPSPRGLGIPGVWGPHSNQLSYPARDRLPSHWLPGPHSQPPSLH